MGLFGPPNVEKMKANRNVQGLIKALTYKKDARVRRAAAEALAEIGDARAVSALIEVLEQRGAGHTYAATALGQIGDARAVQPLIDARAVEPLIDALKSEGGAKVSFAYALGQIGDARAVEPLIDALKDSCLVKREVAARALGQIGAPAVGALIAALQEGAKSTREAAAKVLRELGADTTLEQSVRDRVSAALKGADTAAQASAVGRSVADDRRPSEVIETLFERRRLDPRGRKILAFAILYETEMAPMVRVDGGVNPFAGPMSASDQLRFLAGKIIPGYQPHFVPGHLRIQGDTAVVGRKLRPGESLHVSHINPLLATMLADALQDKGLLNQVGLSTCSALSLSGNSVPTGQARMALIVR